MPRDCGPTTSWWGIEPLRAAFRVVAEGLGMMPELLLCSLVSDGLVGAARGGNVPALKLLLDELRPEVTYDEPEQPLSPEQGRAIWEILRRGKG